MKTRWPTHPLCETFSQNRIFFEMMASLMVAYNQELSGLGTFYNPKCQKHKIKGFFCRFSFAWSLFVCRRLSQRWTATPSTFTLSTGSTATQSTGACFYRTPRIVTLNPSDRMASALGELDRPALARRWLWQADQTPFMGDILTDQIVRCQMMKLYNYANSQSRDPLTKSRFLKIS